MFKLTDAQKSQIKDYVLMMLGAPVIKIELDQAQLDFILDSSMEFICERYDKVEGDKKFDEAELRRLVQEGALAIGKVILGRIRSKFQNPPGPGGSLKLDGKQLLAEGNKEMKEWKFNVRSTLC